jgi:uncharacterized membrane protein SpoIIM required for sporulation
MKEIQFLNSNAERWQTFEQILAQPGHQNPDLLASLYIQLTDDLSYARTHYQGSRAEEYLNNLAMRAHQIIYRNKREKKGRISGFWKTEFPLTVKSIHRNLLYAVLIFFISAGIGVISTLYDDTFVRLILGDDYVNMTQENIDSGDPLAVYKKMNQADMFIGISINNIWVSILAFVFGIFISIGTGYILFSNGVMLGTFFAFFYKKGLFFTAMTTIWLHGTLEIFAILLAGAAGFVLGNSILFPGTFPRLTSFTKGVRTGLKVIIGLVPVFITAAFIEGFITRYSYMPVWLRLFIIGSSLFFIGWYFFFYPFSLKRKSVKSM